MKTNENKKPEQKSNLLKKFSTGAISACVWENEALNQSGEIVSFKSVTVNKRYLDKADNTWKTANSFNLSDVPKAVVCMQKAYEFMVLREKSEENADYDGD